MRYKRSAETKVINESMEAKTEKPDFAEEVILCNSGDEVSEEEDEIQIIDIKPEEASNHKSLILTGQLLLKNALLKGLLPPEDDSSYYTVLNHPNVKRCRIEHSYFMRSRSGTSGYNTRSSPAVNTLTFQNDNKFKQQTIDIECLASEKVNFVSVDDSDNEKNIVNDHKKRKSVSSTSSSDSEESVVDDRNDKDYRPENNSTGTDSENVSVGSDESCDSVQKSNKKTQPRLRKTGFRRCKNVSKPITHKKSRTRHRLGITNYPNINRTPNNFVSVHELLSRIKNMQKLMKTKCSDGKSAKIPPPKLKKMISRGKGDDFPQMSEYLFPMPNLTKMGDKNWRVEYMNDDVQSLGLDDLLLKASELNAENFTKALGRKLDSAKPNFNKDSSEIVFTIPKSKRNSVDSEQSCEDIESEFSKRSNSKTIKLDILKPFFDPDKAKEAEQLQETSKPPEEASPKRPGIKVKTVENINEEFKDSLGLKNKVFQDCSINGIDKEISSMMETRKNLSSVNSFNSPLKDSMLLGKEKDNIAQEELDNKDGEQGRPFIMTIIQGKTEKQRPAILRNSYFKKKVTNTDSTKAVEKPTETGKEDGGPTETNQPESNKHEDANLAAPDPQPSKSQSLDKNNFNGSWCNKPENFSPLFGKNYGSGSYSKIFEGPEEEALKTPETINENRFAVKKRNIPFILNHNRKSRQQDSSPTGNSLPNTITKPQTVPVPSKLVKVNEVSEKVPPNEKTFKVTSIEQKLGPKEANNRRFIKVVPYEPANKTGKKVEQVKGGDSQQKLSDEESDKSPQRDGKSGHVLSLTAFSAILKEILPDKWFLCLDKKYGLQIVKTHVDELLNPSMLISVVIARCGKLTVNVRGKQLEKSHELFSNLCNIANSENKLSLNYVLAILNKLRYLSVCFGCDDQSLKKYWCGDGFVEYQTESQQVYRSHLCQLLVSLGKKRCYPCYRMNESLKKRYRRDKLGEKSKDEPGKEVSEEPEEPEPPKTTTTSTLTPNKGVKRNLEDFLEESFLTMKQQIADEIEKNKKLGERENALKAQEEVLSFMGLARKDSLDNPVRKSKRKKNTFYKLEQPVKKKIDQQELEFLEKYWKDINTLFSTSLLFGAYSRTGRGRLREKCRMFQKLLSTWRDIVRSNPEWIGGEISVPDELIDGDDTLGKESGADHFDKMEVPGLRSYIINSVKEVNRIKHKLRTRNSYFKILYNKFVKRRMKRPKPLSSGSEKKGTASSTNSTTNTPTPTDLSSDESSREKEKTTDDENKPVNDLIMTCVSDGD